MSKELNQNLEQVEGAQGERIVQTAPERIYLIVGAECPRDVDFSELTEVSWCENDIDDGIEYVRADKARAALAQPSPARCQCCGYLVTDSEHRGCLRAAYPVVVTKNDNGQIVAVTRQNAEGQVVDVIAEAQPSPAPELERPEVAAWMWRDLNGDVQFNYMHPEGEPLMTVAQHDHIVGELETRLAMALDAAAKGDAARAILGGMELEKQEPVGVMRASDEPGIAPYADIWPWLEPGTQLYAATVTQAEQVPEGWRRVPIEPTKEILDEFDSIIDQGAEDSKDAWRRLLDAAPVQGGDGIDHSWCDGVCDD